jgi:hypothetical protein
MTLAHPLVCSCLDCLIRRLRDEWWREVRAELPGRLHVDDGESMAEGTSGKAVKPKTNGYPATWTGMPFDRLFERYIDGEHGGDFVASDAFTAVRDWCRREHWREGHTGDNPFGWTACSRVAILYVRLDWGVPLIAEYLNLDAWLVERLLRDALVWAQKWRGDRRSGVVIGDESHKQLNESEALSVVLAREHDVDIQARVWNALRLEYPFLSPWESELARRRTFHAKWCHDRCGLLMAVAA